MPFFNRLIAMVAIAACVGLFNGCTPSEEESGTEPQPLEAGSVTVVAPEPAAMTEPEPAPEPEGITSDSLVGTTWAIADYSVTFEDEGVVRFNSGSEGSWMLADGTITITVAGEDTVIAVEGDQLTHDGMALERQ